MKALELKMPPPLVAFIMLVLAWWCRGVLPVVTAGVWLDVLAALVLLQGMIIAMAGVYEFVRVDTTVHPFHPEHTRQNGRPQGGTRVLSKFASSACPTAGPAWAMRCAGSRKAAGWP